jgi:cation-transporting ATPase 13A3/4/5
MFTCKKLRYVWDANNKMFVKVKSLGPGLPTSMFNQMDAQQGFAGLTVVEQLKRYRFNSNFT